MLKTQTLLRFLKKYFGPHENELNKVIYKNLKSGNLNEIMLVANPGQASYSLNTEKNCSSKPTQATVSSNLLSSASSSLVKNFKTITVQLNRTSNLLSRSVSKAFLPKFAPQIPKNLAAFTVPPTDTHRFPDRKLESTDSLNIEMCHFKPIKTAPITPKKRRTSMYVFKIPKAKKARIEDISVAPIGPRTELSKKLPSSRKKSAFSIVKLPSVESQPKLAERRCTTGRTREAVIRLKRCRLPSFLNSAKETQKEKVDVEVASPAPKRRKNGLIVKTEQRILRSSKQKANNIELHNLPTNNKVPRKTVRKRIQSKEEMKQEKRPYRRFKTFVPERMSTRATVTTVNTRNLRRRPSKSAQP